MKKVWLIPCNDKKVSDLKGGHLPEAGAECALDSFYRRRLAEGDVRKGRKPSAKAATKPLDKSSQKRSGGDD